MPKFYLNAWLVSVFLCSEQAKPVCFRKLKATKVYLLLLNNAGKGDIIANQVT